jgi:peptidoglycan/xylan/chitin deacetylase (PgdA/CDA1 family)
MSILCYHDVDCCWESPMAIQPELLDSHLDWLTRHRQVLPLDQAMARADRRLRLPRGSVALTFDDGFTSMHSELLPRLRRRGLPATVFLVAETLTPAGRPVDWVDTAPADRTLTTLTVDEVLELRDAGVDLQSHSWAHRDLTTLSYDECVTDLRDSRQLLEDLLRQRVTMLAYPRGRHDERVRRAAATAGYRYAFALPEGREAPGPLSVPRVGIHRHNSARVLRVKDSPGYLPLRTSPYWEQGRRVAWAARGRAARVSRAAASRR